jgi:hypothetical protein
MSFTLRTLLAYLDNAPLPAEEREPVQKALDQNPAAQEIVNRIRTLLAQPRMASPAVETAGLLQANQVAEYLDGTSDFDMTRKFEQTCLKNDAALSEVAALHQILTDWIDQPTYIGDELRQRVYQFANSWSDAPVVDEETQTHRAAGREAIQAAAQLLQVREMDGSRESTPTMVSSVAVDSGVDSGSATNSLASSSGRSTGWTAKTTSADGLASAAPVTTKIATSAVGTATTEESGQGSWILALLVLVGFGVLWWSQPAPNAMVGLALNEPQETPKQIMEGQSATEDSSSKLRLPALPSAPTSEGAMNGQVSPSATLPPIHLSGSSTPPPVALTSGVPSLPSASPAAAIPTLPAVEIPALPTPVLESAAASTTIESAIVPSLTSPDPVALSSNPTDVGNTQVGLPSESTTPLKDAKLPGDASAGAAPFANFSPTGTGNLDAFPLAEIKPTLPQPNTTPQQPAPSSEQPRLGPTILELPPIEDNSEVEAADPISAPINAAPISGPLVPAPLGPLPTASLPPSPVLATLPSSSTPEPPAANSTTTTPEVTSTTSSAPASSVTSSTAVGQPLVWGQQIGTVVMEAAANEVQDDWILVLPGGRSELQVRSPRGKAWNMTFSGVSRYQLQDKQGLPQLSVQRCFLLLQCTSQDETLEIQTPKGKLFITSLSPESEMIFEIRPFLPQGYMAATTAPRHYLGCLGISGRIMIEHQEREVVLFENKWMVVKPDGQHQTDEQEFPPAIAETIRELKESRVNPDVTALGSLVQSSEGMDELLSIANGNHVHAQQITLDQRSLAALWGYGLGQLEPVFTILNDAKFKNHWDVHLQAIASCLQADPMASQQLASAAGRFGFNSPIETRFVGIDPNTVKKSQVSELIADLEHAQLARRVLALHSLQMLTNETFGFDPTASTDLSQPAIARWKQWLADSANSRISINPTSTLVPSFERK